MSGASTSIEGAAARQTSILRDTAQPLGYWPGGVSASASSQALATIGSGDCFFPASATRLTYRATCRAMNTSSLASGLQKTSAGLVPLPKTSCQVPASL